MKTLCVVTVVLSLTSVCQSASLACEKLLKPVDTSPDLSGRWYVIAMSLDSCLIPSAFNSFFWPSIAMDITAQATPKVYDADYKLKSFGFCKSESLLFFHDNNNVYAVDKNNAPTGLPNKILQTGCPDCVVGKSYEALLLLISRRKTLSDAEMKEFESQADCLGWYKPNVFNTDHEYDNCTVNIETDEEAMAMSITMSERLTKTFSSTAQCVRQSVMYYPNAAYSWVTEKWNNLW